MTARFRPCGLVLVRSTTDPGDLDVPRDLDFSDPEALQGDGRAWLAKLWERDDAREALALASPDLAQSIARLLDPGAGPASSRDSRRAILAAASYVLRWQRRVTPFGLFAGVLPAGTGPAAGRIGTAHRALARPDADWVTTLAGELERDQELRPRLTVVASNLAFARDGRLLVPLRAAAGAHTPGPPREASIRWTRPVQAAIELAATPVRLDDLAVRVAAMFPAAAPGKVTALLDGLVDQGFLVTSLRPPMSADDPLTHLLRALRSAGAAQVPGTGPVFRDLTRVTARLRAHNACDSPQRAAGLRAEVTARMRALAPARCPLAVDVRLDGHVTIPQTVLDEAASAADVLLRLTTRPSGPVAWLEYHARFLERYGDGALVPVRDLVSDSGLGYPDGYLNTQRTRPAWRVLTERDAALLAMIQQATADGSGEIVLDRSAIQRLTVDDHAMIVPPERAEIGVTVHAGSAAAIDRGDFELHVVATPRAPTSMAGRFAHLLTGSERSQLGASFHDADGDALVVQVSFPPRKPGNENVTRVPPLIPVILPLGEHPGLSEAISVDDLAVTADAAQLYLVHRPAGLRVIPRIPHALDLKAQTPPLARFIAEVATARSAVLGPLDPGAARTLPYIPRIRYRRTVLSPARWLAAASDIPLMPSDTLAWPRHLAAWRSRWQVPARVVLCQGEMRLPLDLDHPLDRELLSARLEKMGRADLREDAPPDGNAWLGRPAELLIPLTLKTPVPRPLPVMVAPGTTARPGGSPVVCARITGSPARFSDIISIHLPALMERLTPGTARRWWATRYRDPVHPDGPQHVEACLRLASPAGLAVAAAELATLAAGLESRRLPGDLTLASYHEHPGRYGHGDAMEAAEEVFATDTVAAAAQIRMAAAGAADRHALAAASMARLSAAFAADPDSGYRALTTRLEQGTGLLDRAVRDQACQLADPSGGYRALRALPGGDAVAAAWTRRDAALAAYHQALLTQRNPATVLPALLRDHHIRALGPDPDTERQVGRYARAAALCRLAMAGLA
jgi:lantibiotic biosynthesis protein